MVNADKLATFMAVYRVKLPEAVALNPDYYHWHSVEKVSSDVVADRMEKAFASGSYHHEGKALQMTCKALGLKHTRKAIEAFLERRGK